MDLNIIVRSDQLINFYKKYKDHFKRKKIYSLEEFMNIYTYQTIRFYFLNNVYLGWDNPKNNYQKQTKTTYFKTEIWI